MPALMFSKVKTGLYQAERGRHHYEIEKEGDWVLSYVDLDDLADEPHPIARKHSKREAELEAETHFMGTDG